MISPSVAYASHRVDERRHQVALGVGGVGPHLFEHASDGIAVTVGPHGLQPLDLLLLLLVCDLEDVEIVVVVALGEPVDADDDASAAVDLALELVGGVGDRALEPAVVDAFVDALQHRAVAELVEVGEHRLGRRFDLVGERLDDTTSHRAGRPRSRRRSRTRSPAGCAARCAPPSRSARRAPRPSSWCAATACRRARRRAPRSRCGRC